MNKVKHDNFERISNSRKEKLLLLFKQLENLDNYSFYEFSEDEINNLFREISEAEARAKKKLIQSAKEHNKKGEM